MDEEGITSVIEKSNFANVKSRELVVSNPNSRSETDRCALMF